MKLHRVAGDLLRGSIVYALTAFGAAHTTSHSSAIFDPIARASADVPSDDREQTEAFDAVCDAKFERDGIIHYYAEHVFARPRSVRQLAGVRVLALVPSPTNAPVPTGAQPIPGYTYRLVTNGIFLRDGAVAVECGDETNGKRFEQVTFLTPRNYKLDIDSTDPW